ncbi:MAG: hypothetical protein IT233_05170 [Bacteroidia bacterium]|nr:hypothetical protein [Bacteroidia bacterium]
MSIVVESPALILLCILAGAVYSGVLYFRNKSAAEIPLALRIVSAAFRFLCVAFIAFYLLDPMIKMVNRETEKPLIVVALDHSASLINGKDSAYYKTQFPDALRKMLDDLASTYDTVTYSFGDKVRNGIDCRFGDKSTDIASLFRELDDRLSNRNVGAIILASDGIYNRGSNPLFLKTGLKCPVFTIALGDSTVRKDLILRNVAHNRYAYLGNTFPVEMFVDARQMKGSRSVLTISKGNQIVFSETISAGSSSYVRTVSAMIEAKEPGLHRYHISLTPVEGEVNLKNNSRDIFIEVLDSRQKILILAQSPHPDVNALRSAIEINRNYEVEVSVIDQFSKGFEAYNLVILHQLPAPDAGANKKLEPLFSSSLPVLFVLGTQSDVVAHARLNAGIKIPEHKGKSNEVTLSPSEGFTLFELSADAKSFYRKYPPLTAPFGNYKSSPSCVPVFYQRIGMVNTGNPAWAFADMGGKKSGIISGEGLWKWRLFEMSEKGNTTYFDDLVSRSVQYLAVKADKSLFRVYGKSDFLENENIELNAEVYNETYELINESEVNIEIIDEEGKKYAFTFTPTGKSYRLNAGILPPGNYHYEARTKSGDKILTARGQFSISTIHLEQVSTTADHQLLYALAKKNAGAMMYPGNMSGLPDILNAREDVKTVTYMHRKLSDLINIRWLFFMLLLLLAAEWLIRKRSGAY